MTHRDDLDRLVELGKTDIKEAGRQLLQLVRKERPDQGALSVVEYRMMERWWNNDFDDEQTYLTSEETVNLINAWYKMDRQKT